MDISFPDVCLNVYSCLLYIYLYNLSVRLIGWLNHIYTSLWNLTRTHTYTYIYMIDVFNARWYFYHVNYSTSGRNLLYFYMKVFLWFLVVICVKIHVFCITDIYLCISTIFWLLHTDDMTLKTHLCCQLGL